jgi:hypothetical protein
LLREAIDAGEVSADSDEGVLAKLVETTLAGSLLTWAIYRDGGAARWLRADLDAVLAPYLVRQRRRRS